MRRYTLSEMILRQLIREEVRGFSYTGIGIGSSTEAQKTSYITIAAKALGVTFAVAGALYVKDSWDNWSKNIEDFIAEATKIKGILTTAATTFNNLPQSLSLSSLASALPGASTPATPAQAAATGTTNAPQQEHRRRRGALIAEDITRSYRVIKTDYGDLVDTNAIEILSANVKIITGSGTRIIQQMTLDKIDLKNLDKFLESLFPSISSALSKIDNLPNKDKNPKALATKFGFNVQDSSDLAPVEGETNTALLDVQKRIANAFMCDAIAVLIYDKMCNEVLENVGRIAEMKDTIAKSDSDKEEFDSILEKFGESWLTLIKQKLSQFAQMIISGEVFKE